MKKTFDQLLTWNLWWDENRNLDGYLCWGSDPVASLTGDRREKIQNVHKAASNESGLDNSPMYEDAPFDTINHKILVGDVGLMSLYVGDRDALVFISNELGRDEEVHELQTRAATREQAERMISEHLYNPDEFWGDFILPSIARNDSSYTGEDYWRGSIWATMNFLVDLGMRNYNLPQARQHLAQKSRSLLLREWHTNGWIRENYHAEHGGAPSRRSSHFDHWGALLAMIDLMENAGY